MSFLLDTDICSAALRQERKLFSRFVQYSGRLHTSRIALVELYEWAHGGKKPNNRWIAVERFLDEVSVIDFDDVCAQCSGEIRFFLRANGFHVPDMDVLIGATALIHDMTLVTHNTKDFENIPGLRLADWLA